MSDYDLTIRDRLEDILDSINLKISQGLLIYRKNRPCDTRCVHTPKVTDTL
jgi:hypothetical protein